MNKFLVFNYDFTIELLICVEIVFRGSLVYTGWLNLTMRELMHFESYNM